MATPYMIFPNEMTLTVDSLSHKVAERIIAEKPPIKLAGETYTEAEDNSHYPAHHVVIDPYIEFVDAKDKRIYRAEGVYETSNEMKLILALGEYRNIYIKDYILEVDDYSFNVIIKFRELVKGNPLENENNTSTVNLHFESKDRYISSIELEEWGKYAYCSGALMSNKEEGEIVYEIMLDELRDYRFYARDLLHPSDTAVEFIAERFADWCFSPALCRFAAERARLIRARNHRPLHPESDEHRAFRAKLREEVELFTEKWGFSPF